MAQELIEAIPDLPNPLRTGQKIGIVIGILLLVVLVCGVCSIGSICLNAK